MTITVHKLGFGHGLLLEDVERGTVQYTATGKLLPAFSVRIADVTGISAQRQGMFKIAMKVHGQGTVLAEVDVNNGTTEIVSDWFSSRIGMGATRVSAVPGTNLSDEITKLAALNRNGALSDEEFAAAKRKLIGLE